MVLVQTVVQKSPILEHFHHPKKKSCTHISYRSLIPHSPQPPATTNLLSVSMDLPVLNISYEWNHTICDLL